MVTLFCAIIGVKGNAFLVDIEASKSVGHLKEAIQKKKEKTITCDPDELELFLAKKGDAWLTENEVKHVTDTINLKHLNAVRAKLHRVGLSDDQVKVDDDMDAEESEGNGPVNVLVVVPVPIVVAAATKKRKLAEVRELITPSSFAKCKGGGSWVKLLKKLDGQIECHRIERSDDETTIPLVLLNKTFARFEQNCKQIEFGNEDCEFVMKLCHGMSTPYESEAALAEKARELLKEYLLVDYPASTITPATVNGSVSDGSYRFGETLLLNLECKLQKGDGGGDPTMQNVAYYIKHLPAVIDHQFPCFLVDICGPLMSVFGIVNTGDENAICEPLVMSFPLLFFDNEWLMVSLTRVCASLKIALHELTEECIQLVASRRNVARCLYANDLDRLRFPYKDSFEINGTTTSLQYVRVVQRYIFVAKVHDGNELIVKFAKRYGTEVHQYCSSARFAPALKCCELLPNGWAFVVMEKPPLIPIAQANGVIARQQLLEIQHLMSNASLVHGDLRENNVMWDPVKNRVALVDFDWSGRDGIATYPPFMNGAIVWPQGAESGKPLRVAHDAYWLELLWPRLQCD